MTPPEQVHRVRQDLINIFDFDQFSPAEQADPWTSLFDSRQVLIEALGIQDEVVLPETTIGSITLEAALAEVPIHEGNPEICSRAEARFLYTLRDFVRRERTSRKDHFIFIDPDDGVAAIQKGHVAETVLSLKQTPEFPSAPGAIFLGDSTTYHLAKIGEEIAPGFHVVPIGETEFEFGRYTTFAIPEEEAVGLTASAATVRVDDMKTPISEFAQAVQDFVDAA